MHAQFINSLPYTVFLIFKENKITTEKKKNKEKKKQNKQALNKKRSTYHVNNIY